MTAWCATRYASSVERGAYFNSSMLRPRSRFCAIQEFGFILDELGVLVSGFRFEGFRLGLNALVRRWCRCWGHDDPDARQGQGYKPLSHSRSLSPPSPPHTPTPSLSLSLSLCLYLSLSLSLCARQGQGYTSFLPRSGPIPYVAERNRNNWKDLCCFT